MKDEKRPSILIIKDGQTIDLFSSSLWSKIVKLYFLFILAKTADIWIEAKSLKVKKGQSILLVKVGQITDLFFSFVWSKIIKLSKEVLANALSTLSEKRGDDSP
ncbi:hypothetical protein GXP75_02545 [Bacillus sp. HU-1818]|nr:hypothetical protein [Bacillus sp. HU-1818]